MFIMLCFSKLLVYYNIEIITFSMVPASSSNFVWIVTLNFGINEHYKEKNELNNVLNLKNNVYKFYLKCDYIYTYGIFWDSNFDMDIKSNEKIPY